MTGGLKNVIDKNEKILYSGKPNKKCFMFKNTFFPVLLIGLCFILFDAALIPNIVNCFAYFLMINVVLLAVTGLIVLFVNLKYKNIEYVVTNRSIYISSGIFSYNINVKPFAELSHINLRRGIFDQLFKVGTIEITSNQLSQNRRNPVVFTHTDYGNRNNSGGDFTSSVISSIFETLVASSIAGAVDSNSNGLLISGVSDYVNLYNLIKKLQLDVYTDVMYPNEKRPPKNQGYNTEYNDINKLN